MIATGIVGTAELGATLGVTAAAAGGWVQGSIIDQILINRNHGRSWGDVQYDLNQEIGRWGDALWKNVKPKVSKCVNGSGIAGLTCGPGCGWNFNIQVSPNRQVFNLVDVVNSPGDVLAGTAIK